MFVDEAKLKEVQEIFEQEENLHKRRMELLFPSGIETAIKEVEREQWRHIRKRKILGQFYNLQYLIFFCSLWIIFFNKRLNYWIYDFLFLSWKKNLFIIHDRIFLKSFSHKSRFFSKLDISKIIGRRWCSHILFCKPYWTWWWWSWALSTNQKQYLLQA